jgi:itaconate CoA-transferase
VVALEQAVSAPLCTRHLADLGADVIKVERPGVGDFARQYDSAVEGQSAYFVWLNRGKRSVQLDLADPKSQAVLKALLARADVFVHNLGPGSVDRMGLGWQDLHTRWPTVISCGISGYGPDGPYSGRKAFDLLLQGEAGLLAITGTPEHPAKVGISIADICAGMYALSGVLTALYERRQTNEGKSVEISMLECLAEWMMVPIYHQLYADPPLREGMRHNLIVPYGPFRSKDARSVNVAVQNQGQWTRLCEKVLERPDLADDTRFLNNELRVRNRTQLEPLIEEIFSQLTSAAIERKLAAADIPYGHVNSVAELADHAQLASRNKWIEVPGGGAGAVRALADPFNISGRPQAKGAVPRLGEHTLAVLQELGMSE